MSKKRKKRKKNKKSEERIVEVNSVFIRLKGQSKKQWVCVPPETKTWDLMCWMIKNGHELV